MRRRAPRPASLALGEFTAGLAPRTPLAAVQGIWLQAVGETVAREATPVSERAGIVTVACRSAVWAQELDLMSADVVERLNGPLEQWRVEGLRCVTGDGGRRR